jgi:hypothetical protein
MTYELWDSSTGNCIGAYPSQGAALDSVALLARRFGMQSREVVTLGLVAEDDDDRGGLIAQGTDLVNLALRSATQLA